MKALILAAGKGSRLGPLTATCPKPMLPVGGQPLLVHVIRWLRQYGITEVAINLHHLPEKITEQLGDGAELGVAITYSYEPELLGTAGAAKKLQTFFDTSFVVAYGDLFTNVDLGRILDLHRRRRTTGCLLTMALYRVPNPTECGLVEIAPDGRVLRFVEKPPAEEVFTDLANSGILVCEPTLLDYVPAHSVYDFGHHLLPHLLALGLPVYGQEIGNQEYLIDIGTPAGYARAEQAVAYDRALV